MDATTHHTPKGVPSRRGPLLAEARKAAGVSRRDAVYWSGVPLAELKAYEAGERTPSPSVVRRITAAIVTASSKRTAEAVGGARFQMRVEDGQP